MRLHYDFCSSGFDGPSFGVVGRLPEIRRAGTRWLTYESSVV